MNEMNEVIIIIIIMNIKNTTFDKGNNSIFTNKEIFTTKIKLILFI